MRVTAVIAIVSQTRAHILRLTGERLHHLVVSDYAARVVLRYWRLQRGGQRVLFAMRRRRMRPSSTLVGHALVLALGFVLVVDKASALLQTLVDRRCKGVEPVSSS